MRFLLFLKKRQNFKLSAANYRRRFMGLLLLCIDIHPFKVQVKVFHIHPY